MPRKGKNTNNGKRDLPKKGKQVLGGGIGQKNALYGANMLAPTVTRGLTPVGFPALWRTQHRYVQSNVLNAATGSLGIYQFRVNSLFDPDLTGTGHQPYGFDQFKTYYATYLVVKSQITVECIVITSPSLCGVMTSTESSTGLATADTYTEPGRGQGGVVSPVFGAPRVFQAQWALSQIPDHDPADYSAAIGASPTNSDFYTVYSQDAFALAASPVMYFTVCIVFDVEWRDPITIASS